MLHKNNYIEIAKFYVTINAQRGGRHYLSKEQDALLVKELINVVERYINENENFPLIIGQYSYKRGCIEVCIPLLIEFGADAAEYVWQGTKIIATLGGAHAAINALKGWLKNRYIENPETGEQHLTTFYKIENYSDEELMAELNRRTKPK